ncbi:helix-turn-helix domain-containing protein [bacterium AH-315-P07]|nr:helix-turn-helix domain-containing protein [bacterium AH-315-P07]
MAFPGHILKQKRENLGFSLQEITDHLSIPADIIDALESGDPSRIPESSFTSGFLRSYCNFLGLEAEMMIADLQKASKTKHSKRLKAKALESGRTTFKIRLPKLTLPSISINLPTEVIGWVSITALLVLGWIAYSTFAPSTDSDGTNETEATTINLRVPEPNSGRSSR